jgi:phosphoribosylaminoimidazolecarboxamide formyltransferase / IMP cyclohydrolase
VSLLCSAVGGAVFAQSRNDVAWGVDLLDTVVTPGSLTEAEKRDLVVASIACKYTQSNSVVYAINGQTVGVGAGQQSRVDCVKLAGRKVDTWWLRQHPKVQGLQFVAGTKRQDRVNARVAYIDGVAPGSPEEAAFLELLAEAPESLTDAEKAAWVQDGELNDVCVSSDAFFPFRDSIDQLARHGVRAIVQPGGSVQDEGVTEACNEYGMIMAHSGVRLFHH